ncbi:hypothetical protein SH661x_001794 [Planctomicrobium sp. SH661]|uniref:hypothetical protein n=1 Tax=Planctomicrobium sp. SH661 TaxID=3448124 RepID=UPI003F5B2A9C
MQPEFLRGTYFEVEGPSGCDIVPIGQVEGTFPETFDKEKQPVPDALQPFCENTTCYSITKRFGWCVRMQEPGYLDSTDWSGFRTEREAIEYVLDTYGDEDEFAQDWQKELERRLTKCK